MSSGHEEHSNPYKCVIIGDACVGKTCMASRIVGRSPNLQDYEPTIFENTEISVSYRGQRCRLEICDTAGQEDYAHLRPSSYGQADAFLLCFCLVTRDSFDNLETVWLPELKKHQGKARVILVGTKLDLYKANESQGGAISRTEIDALRRKHGFEYVQCSAVTCDGIQEVIDRTLAVLHGASDTAEQGKRRRGRGLMKKCSIL